MASPGVATHLGHDRQDLIAEAPNKGCREVFHLDLGRSLVTLESGFQRGLAVPCRLDKTSVVSHADLGVRRNDFDLSR